MSDADAETGEEETDGDDDLPEIEEEEMADFAAVAESIEDTDEGTDDTDTETTEETDSDAEESEEEETDAPDELGDISLGTVYTNGLGMAAAVGRERYGDADTDRDELAEEYAQMARQIEIDAYLDKWMAENSGLDHLGPGQAVLLGTLIWGGMVMIDDPEMAAGLYEEVAPDA